MSDNLLDKVEKMTCQAVQDVFQKMLKMSVANDSPVPLAPDPNGQIVGAVGFIGAANGVIYLYVNISFARVIASRMLGLNESELEGDEMVNDAMGELTNMVVGQVKSRLCDSGLICTLTVPSIVRGPQLSVGGGSDTKRRVTSFKNCENRLLAEMILKAA